MFYSAFYIWRSYVRDRDIYGYSKWNPRSHGECSTRPGNCQCYHRMTEGASLTLGMSSTLDTVLYTIDQDLPSTTWLDFIFFDHSKSENHCIWTDTQFPSGEALTLLTDPVASPCCVTHTHSHCVWALFLFPPLWLDNYCKLTHYVCTLCYNLSELPPLEVRQ